MKTARRKSSQKTAVAALAELFGSRRALAEAIGVDNSLLPVWEKRSSPDRKAGRIPTRYNRTILDAAKRLGIPHDAVAAHLDDHACPLCGQELPPGRIGLARNFSRWWGRKGRKRDEIAKAQ